jgi:hypothetical protein
MKIRMNQLVIFPAGWTGCTGILFFPVFATNKAGIGYGKGQVTTSFWPKEQLGMANPAL